MGLLRCAVAVPRQSNLVEGEEERNSSRSPTKRKPQREEDWLAVFCRRQCRQWWKPSGIREERRIRCEERWKKIRYEEATRTRSVQWIRVGAVIWEHDSVDMFTPSTKEWPHENSNQRIIGYIRESRASDSGEPYWCSKKKVTYWISYLVMIWFINHLLVSSQPCHRCWRINASYRPSEEDTDEGWKFQGTLLTFFTACYTLPPNVNLRAWCASYALLNSLEYFIVRHKLVPKLP